MKGDGSTNDVPKAGTYAPFVTAAVNRYEAKAGHGLRGGGDAGPGGGAASGEGDGSDGGGCRAAFGLAALVALVALVRAAAIRGRRGRR